MSPGGPESADSGSEGGGVMVDMPIERLRAFSRARYYLRGGMLFRSRMGTEDRILSFCIDHPEQGPVVALAMVSVK